MLSNARVRSAVKVSNIVAMVAGYLSLAALLIAFLFQQQSVGLELSRTAFRDSVHAAVTSSGYQWNERSANDSLRADAEGVHLWLNGPSDDLEWAMLELYVCPCDGRAGVQGLAAGSFIGVAFPDLDGAAWLQNLSSGAQTHAGDGRVLIGRHTLGRVVLTIESED